MAGIRIESLPRRVRVMAEGRMVADTTTPLMVWEVPFYPTYYFPVDDVDIDVLVEAGATDSHPQLGDALAYDLVLDDSKRERAAYSYPAVDELAEHLAFRWKAMDHWFEEDDEVFVHARNPYTRLDILRSSRAVRVEVDGETVADSTNATFLYETGLPVRYYLPKTDVRFDLLSASDKETHCPYKGAARYWNLTVGDEEYRDLVWGYDYPIPESEKVAGLVCFYNEKVDLFIDGELQERPTTKFA